ncbi:uncharacterized protein BDZ99DRAFT_52683 [Mytilinidion resinicola]|uniref:Uncharacterized protein n=1 Tax=Mytilinidion resinicola TaxID=574789 RepID=A0A6A6YHS7_9PEZI|nr:uncharacterized protein BDZ99DRAFT_52683 [Mytilinidion resinicola]KAF2808330.1 hypothetical protein BDZ99DRAFT_52683 [Mytilinidion resinicola]
MSNSNTNKQRKQLAGERTLRTTTRPPETTRNSGANVAIADRPLASLPSQASQASPSLGAARELPPPSFQLHAAEHTEFCQVTAVLNEASTGAGHLAPTHSHHHHHALPTEAIPALDTFKRNWYQDWFKDRSVEKTDPYGFTSAGTSTATSPNVSRAGTPVPAVGGNYATARRQSLDQQHAATG